MAATASIHHLGQPIRSMIQLPSLEMSSLMTGAPFGHIDPGIRRKNLAAEDPYSGFHLPTHGTQ